MLFGLCAVYLGVLVYEQHRAEQRLSRMRDSDPATYLDTIRGRESFAEFMRDVAEIRGYRTWRPRVPEFLAGRWALFRAEQRVGPEFVPAPCHPSVLFEDGGVHVYAGSERRYGARYRIQDGDVMVELDGKSALRVHVVGLERRIRNLSLELPEDGLRYAYRCG
ncbi:hypothetical protein [Rhodovibrio salinarum]|uniref:hypothetical protein n=1 Tax=Rhodovibrio salinarum TaxID=1087 RepID=UPI0012DE3173|nr:hypothetical protein [Rhodovibrio salinarum]